MRRALSQRWKVSWQQHLQVLRGLVRRSLRDSSPPAIRVREALQERRQMPAQRNVQVQEGMDWKVLQHEKQPSAELVEAPAELIAEFHLNRSEFVITSEIENKLRNFFQCLTLILNLRCSVVAVACLSDVVESW